MSDTITLIRRSQQGDRDASERLVTENTGLIELEYYGQDDLQQLYDALHTIRKKEQH